MKCREDFPTARYEELLSDDKLKKRVHNIWKTAGGRDFEKVGRVEVKERIDEIKKATSERRDAYTAQLLHAEKEGKELCAVHMQTATSVMIRN